MIIKYHWNYLKYYGNVITPLFFVYFVQNKKHNSSSSAIHVKNQFLKQKITINKKLISFFIQKGYSIYPKKVFTFTYLSLIRGLLGLNIVYKNNFNLIELVKQNPDIIRIIKTNTNIQDFGYTYMWRVSNLIPRIKAVCITTKKKKIKKIKKKSKYVIKYKFVNSKVRLQVLNRWFSLLIKVENRKLDVAFNQIISQLLVDPIKSKLYKLKQKIYSDFRL